MHFFYDSYLQVAYCLSYQRAMNKILIPPTIILLSPQMGENIGASARAMYNFGLTDLRLVTPRDGWPNDTAVTMAAGAQSVIHNAKCYNHIEEAISDCHVIAATTARTRDIALPSHTPRSLYTDLYTPDTRLGLLFGCEKSGLTNEDISYANTLIHIDVNPDYGSLNLAQAVGILSYEWYSGTRMLSEKSDRLSDNIAPKEDITYLYNHLEQALDDKGFFKIVEKRHTMIQNIRTIFSRCRLTSQEVQTLRGILKCLGR